MIVSSESIFLTQPILATKKIIIVTIPARHWNIKHLRLPVFSHDEFGG